MDRSWILLQAPSRCLLDISKGKLSHPGNSIYFVHIFDLILLISSWSKARVEIKKDFYIESFAFSSAPFSSHARITLDATPTCLIVLPSWTWDTLIHLHVDAAHSQPDWASYHLVLEYSGLRFGGAGFYSKCSTLSCKLSLAVLEVTSQWKWQNLQEKVSSEDYCIRESVH